MSDSEYRPDEAPDGRFSEEEFRLHVSATDFSKGMEMMAEAATSKGFALWLQHRNNLLGGRTPLEVLEDDPRGYEKVGAAARCFADTEWRPADPSLLE